LIKNLLFFSFHLLKSLLWLLPGSTYHKLTQKSAETSRVAPRRLSFLSISLARCTASA